MPKDTAYAPAAALVLLRCVQAALGLTATLFAWVALTAYVSALTVLSLGTFVVVLLLMILVLEVVAVRGLRRWADTDPDA